MRSRPRWQRPPIHRPHRGALQPRPLTAPQGVLGNLARHEWASYALYTRQLVNFADVRRALTDVDDLPLDFAFRATGPAYPGDKPEPIAWSILIELERYRRGEIPRPFAHDGDAERTAIGFVSDLFAVVSSGAGPRVRRNQMPPLWPDAHYYRADGNVSDPGLSDSEEWIYFLTATCLIELFGGEPRSQGLILRQAYSDARLSSGVEVLVVAEQAPSLTKTLTRLALQFREAGCPAHKTAPTPSCVCRIVDFRFLRSSRHRHLLGRWRQKVAEVAILLTL